MRLGELLLHRRLITQDQLDRALEEQQTYGKRLGTNLVQLGFADLDALSRALGEQRGRPGALRKHVANIDKRLFSIFPARAIASYQAVPLGYTTTTPPRLIVACVDPTVVPVDELAFAAGCRVDVWVAPELLVEECLHRHLGAPRAPARFIEVDFGTPGELSEGAPISVPTRSSQPSGPPSSRGPTSGRASAPPVLTPPPAASRPSRPSLRQLTPPPHLPEPSLAPPPPPASARAQPPAFLEPPPPPVEPPPPSDPPPPPPVKPPPVVEVARGFLSDPELPPDSGWDVPEPAAAAEATEETTGPISAPSDMLRPVIDQAEASRLLEMATTKERVGVVLADWLRSTFGCGLVLVVRNDMAVGWQGYFPDAEELIEAVAVPLSKPSMFSVPFEGRDPFCGEPADAKANQLFWKLLRCTPPSEVIICPVVIAKRAVNLLYAHAMDDSPLTDTQFLHAKVLAADAGAAYMRIIRRERAK